MEENILKQYPTAEAFETYWKENYIPVTYEDVKEAFEDFVTSAAGHIYISDYEEKNCISKTDFKENLSQAAEFSFQDSLTEAFYDKNSELYETAFAIYEEEQLSGVKSSGIAQIFHETYTKLYQEFLDRLFDERLSK